MPKFTVILLRPDYIADSATPTDIFTDYVNTRGPARAVLKAQARAAAFDRVEECGGSPADYHPIAVFRGHLEHLL